MAQLVKIFVVFSLLYPILFRRNDNFHPCCFCDLNQFVDVVATVRQKSGCFYPFNQLFSIRAIRNGTRCNKDSDRHAMRIHDQVYLGIEPPFVLPMS